jgi:hypothetical protein
MDTMFYARRKGATILLGSRRRSPCGATRFRWAVHPALLEAADLVEDEHGTLYSSRGFAAMISRADHEFSGIGLS